MRRHALILLALGAMAGGCGDSESEPTDTGADPSALPAPAPGADHGDRDAAREEEE